MNIDVFDKYYVPTPQSAPAFLDPFPGNVSVDQQMQMRDATLVKFKNSDVFDGRTKPPAKIQPKLVEHLPQISYRVTLDQLRIEC